MSTFLEANGFRILPDKEAITPEDPFDELSLAFELKKSEEKPRGELLAKLCMVDPPPALRERVADEGVNIVWGYSLEPDAITLEELRELDYTNNLDSVLDYTDGFNDFTNSEQALLETIRRGLNAKRDYQGTLVAWNNNNETYVYYF